MTEPVKYGFRYSCSPHDFVRFTTSGIHHEKAEETNNRKNVRLPEASMFVSPTLAISALVNSIAEYGGRPAVELVRFTPPEALDYNVELVK